MSQLIQRVSAELRQRRLLAPSQKILVAVSGGLDSMVLLNALNVLASGKGWEISVAHFNHQLRGQASLADEKLVRATAAKLGLRFYSGRANVKAFAARGKLSIEMAARELRHEFLARIARRQNIFTIALAHHADDQAELFFLRLLRGAGGEGVSGMKWISPSPVDKKLRLVRPLLGLTKTELRAFAAEQGVKFREDVTNASDDFLRNRVRRELLPFLAKKYQPSICQTVPRLMEIIGAEAEFVAAVARQWLVKSAPSFEELALAVQRQVLNLQLHAHDVSADFELVEQLRTQPGKRISIGKDATVSCVAGKLIRHTVLSADFNLEALTVSSLRRSVQFGGRRFNWNQKLVRSEQGRRPAKFRANASSFFESFDADEIGDEVVLRHWRSGDRFQPIGMPQSVKLQDLFVNAKIPASRRRELIVATTASGEIFWVEGLRIGERFKLTPSTKVKLEWKCSVLPL